MIFTDTTYPADSIPGAVDRPILLPSDFDASAHAVPSVEIAIDVGIEVVQSRPVSCAAANAVSTSGMSAHRSVLLSVQWQTRSVS